MIVTGEHDEARTTENAAQMVAALERKKEKPVVALASDGKDLFIVYNGKRIAKRGHHGTPQAETWIPLEPGYTVTSNDDHSEIVIEHFGVRVH